MSEPPQNPPPGDDGRTPPNDSTSKPEQAAGATPSAEAPADDRPPPYQGAYGAPPGQQPLPAYGQYAQQPGHPGAAPPAGHPGYGPPGYGPPGGHLGGRGARLGAAILDSLILAVIALPVMLASIRWDRYAEIIESGQPMTDINDIYNIPVLLTGYAIVFVVGFAYYAGSHAKWGQTLGKRACGIRLVSAADQSAVTWKQAAGRQGVVYAISIGTIVLNFVAPGASLLISILALLDVAWILWDQQRQALHDKAVGTIVVRTGPWAPNPYAKS